MEFEFPKDTHLLSDESVEEVVQPSGTAESSEPHRIGKSEPGKELRRSSGTRNSLNCYRTKLNSTMEQKKEPVYVQGALNCPESECWRIAMQKEMEPLLKNKVWDLVDLPPHRKAVGNKWVVAKGFSQKEGLATMKHSALLSDLSLFVVLCLLQFREV